MYQVQLLDNDQVKKTLGFMGLGPDIHHAMGLARLTLDFDDRKSVFYSTNSQLSQQQHRNVGLFTGVEAEKSWWQDARQSYKMIKKSPPLITENYLLVEAFESDESHTGWSITDESKEIGGYTCFKATRTNVRQAPNQGEKFAFPIIAWFSPEIPLPYGPKQYGGLPGLILELQDEMVHFGIISVSFDGDIYIPEEPDYKHITDSEFGQILMENRDAFQRSRGRQ